MSTFKVNAIVCDSTWKNNPINTKIRLMQKDFLLKRTIIKYIVIDEDEITDKDALTLKLSGLYRCDIVVLNPVVAYACSSLGINPSSLLELSSVYAITNRNDKNYFKCIFVSDSESAWQSVEPNENIVICKNPNDIVPNMATQDFSKQFVLDYRYANVVPSKMLYGVIEPKLEDVFKEKSAEVVLNYEFRKIKRQIF